MFSKGPGEDRLIMALTVSLVLFGLVMVYSSSSVLALRKFADPAYFLKKQAACAVVGLAAMFAVWNTDYKRLRRLSLPLVAAAFVLLVLVLVFGVEINGSTRWFRIGGMSVQPSELAKPALIVFLAASLSKRADRLHDFVYGLGPYLLITGALLFLVLLEPDLGTTLALGALIAAMLFVAGARKLHLAGLAAAAGAVLCVQALRTDYWMARIATYLHPSRDPLGAGFQIKQSLMAFGGGGLTGVGLGESMQKLLFLPEPHSDFIFSVVGEELGLAGALFVVAAFALITYFGLRLSMRCRDGFGKLVSFGVTALIAMQALVNMGVSTGLLPNKGMPLPFISAGGTSLVVMLLCVGMLLSVARAHNNDKAARQELVSMPAAA